MMRRILFITGILIFSCACRNNEEQLYWEEQPFLELSNPYPEDGSTDVAIRTRGTGFSTIGRSSHFDDDEFLFAAYFDTINPPKRKITIEDYSFPVDIFEDSLSLNTTYYWKLVNTYPGIFQSDIHSFTTSGFEGKWKLFTIADKREVLKHYNLPGRKFSWSNWSEWDNTSYYLEGEALGRTTDISITDLVVEDVDFQQIQISGNNKEAELVYYGRADTEKVSCTFTYQNGGVIVKEKQSDTTHKFPAANVGQIVISRKPWEEALALVLVKPDGMVLIYKKEQ